MSRLKNNAEYQRRSLMTKEEKAREAIDRTARNAYNSEIGKGKSFEECRREIVKIAEREDRKQNG